MNYLDEIVNNSFTINNLYSYNIFSKNPISLTYDEYNIDSGLKLTYEPPEKSNDYKLTFSSQSEYLRENGRIISLPKYSECVTYDITYSKGNETKTVTLSTILPSAFK